MILKNHLGHYASLFVVFLISLVFIILVSNTQTRVLVAVFTAFFYVSWGIFHHLIHHNLSAKIVVEYVLIGSLGLAFIMFLLKGGLGF
jgi:hypothetical protein